MLVSVFCILAIIFAVFLADLIVRHFLRKMAPERKKMLTLRSLIAIAIRAIAVVMILLVIFGMPSQFATVLAA